MLRTLIRDERIGARYRLAGTLTLVDAAHAATTLAAQPEAVRQIAAADRLLISKSDLVSADELDALRATLTGINPFAPQVDLQREQIDATLLAPPATPLPRYLPATPAGHDVRAPTPSFDRPLAQNASTPGWPTGRRSPVGLLRMKALLDVEGPLSPLVLHGVQHTLQPPAAAAWPDGVLARPWCSPRHGPRNAARARGKARRGLGGGEATSLTMQSC